MKIREWKKTYQNYHTSYSLPTPTEAIRNSYTVLRYSLYAHYFEQYDDSYDYGNLEKAISAMIKLLTKLRDKESEKEDRFFRWYRTQIVQKDPSFLNTFDRLYTANDYSALMTAIENRRRNLYDARKSFDKNLTSWMTQWNKSQNRTFIEKFTENLYSDFDGKTIKDLEKSNILDITFQEMFDNAKQNFLNSAYKSAEESFSTELEKVWVELEKLFRRNLEHDNRVQKINMSSSLRSYIQQVSNTTNGKKLLTTKDKRKKDGTNAKTLKQLITSIVSPLINGMSAEIYLDIGEGTVRTGNVQQRNKGLSGRVTSVNTKSDDIAIFSDTIEITTNFEQEMEEILNKARTVYYEDIQERIKLYDEDNFIVHYSSKDLYRQPNTNYNVSLRGNDSSLDNAFYQLRQIASVIQKGNINDLLFAMANAGEGGYMQDNTQSIERAIVSLCATWMFEDYEDTFAQIKSGVINNHLHVYFISGLYYTISDILNLTIDQLEKADEKTLVYVKFKPSDKDPYPDVQFDRSIRGIPRWEYVRNKNLQAGRLSISMNTKILEDMLLSID